MKSFQYNFLQTGSFLAVWKKANISIFSSESI